MPLFAVEFKAPHKLTLSMLVAGLCEMDLDCDILNTDDDSPEYHMRHLVAAVVTQIFSYMVDMGVQKGLFCTGEADVYLYITEDPSIVKYFLCVPNKDVVDSDNFVSIGRLSPSVLPLLLMLYKMIVRPRNGMTQLMRWIRGRLSTSISYDIFPSPFARSHPLPNTNLLRGSLLSDPRICCAAAANHTREHYEEGLTMTARRRRKMVMGPALVRHPPQYVAGHLGGFEGIHAATVGGSYQAVGITDSSRTV
jgi:hypothetical protein